jgi:hypothetical protein
MEFKIPKELEIKLKINGFDDSDIGDKIFKPKHVDEKLGDKLYFTDNYELSSDNLDKVDLKVDKVDFKNDVDKHRYILSSKSKMREFIVKMQTGDRGAKGARYAEQSVKEANKKLDEAKEKQSKVDETEIKSMTKELETAKEEKEKEENVEERREKEKKIAILEANLEAAKEGNEKFNKLQKTLEAAKETLTKSKAGSSDDKLKNEIIKTNLKFILKTFFANKTNIKISPNDFMIYSSGIGTGILHEAKDTEKKGSKKSQLIKQTTTFNIKIFEKKDKVGVLDMAKVGCKERAERIEKDVFELLGISVDLFQNSNVYNPVNILNKLRVNSSKKDAIREERIRVEKERELEKREEKSVRKQAKLEAKEERKRRAREKNKMKGIEADEEEEEDSDDDDDYDIDNPKDVANFTKRDLRHRMKEAKKRRKNNNGGNGEQKGGYKYRGKSARKDRKTRRKTPKSNRKTRRKYR